MLAAALQSQFARPLGRISLLQSARVMQRV